MTYVCVEHKGSSVLTVFWWEVTCCKNRPALKHVLFVLWIGPSSTGMVAFIESSDIVFHSLISSLFACFCSYSANLNSIMFELV